MVPPPRMLIQKTYFIPGLFGCTSKVHSLQNYIWWGPYSTMSIDIRAYACSTLSLQTFYWSRCVLAEVPPLFRSQEEDTRYWKFMVNVLLRLGSMV